MVCLPPAKPRPYRPRQPLESDFHRLVREHFDSLRAVYADRYARRFGHWRRAIDHAVAEFLRCGDLNHGFARVRCPDCRHEFLVAFSCKQRCICPSCSQKRTLLFGMHVADDICQPVPHRQFVWTIPKRLRVFFRFHRDLLNRLPALAWETVTETYAAILGPDVRPGAVLAIQTFGQLIHFHPHLHALVTDGAFASAGRFVHLPAISHEPFLRLWEHKVFRLLLDENLIDYSLVEQIRSWRHTGFNVDRSVRIEAGDRDGIERLAQYMARSPFSLARLVRITPAGKVLYKSEKDRLHRFPDPASGDLFGGVKRNFQLFEPLDFLAELTQHIPNKGEHLTRYYGCYSNKARGTQIRGTGILPVTPSSGNPGEGRGEGNVAQPPPAVNTPPAKDAPRRRWAMLIKRVYQSDPLLCPNCGGTMKVIALIESHQGEILEKILRHCGLWHDPHRRGPPASAEVPEPDHRRTIEPDPEFLELARREEQAEQLDLAFD